MMQIDLRSGVPAYLQIIQQIQGMILRGELRPGDQLPTVRQLAAELSINFNTIARAYRLLDQSGFITTQHGRGTFVLEEPGSSEASQTQTRAGLLADLTAGFLAEAARLGSTPQEVLEAVKSHVLDPMADEGIQIDKG